MKIGLFGGTFDPIHYAHVELALAMKQQLGLDEVWFMVTPQNPWKQNSRLSADEHRLQMVKLAIKGKDGLVVSDYEFHLEKPTYSYLTLRHLREDFPQHEFTLMIGGDNWAQFDHWANYEEILHHHAIAVYPRPDSEVDATQFGGNVTILHAPQMAVSSTSIRQKAANGESLSGLVCSDVEEYIIKNNLYKE